MSTSSESTTHTTTQQSAGQSAQHHPNGRGGTRPTTSPEVIAAEIAGEQAHVDRVYARLAEAARSARQVASEGRALYQSDRNSYVREEDGTGLYERDVFAFQAAKRLATLDAEHEGLVFGRLDRTNSETHYIGRIGVRDDDYEPLVIDWRAPAAEPFYRATPTRPMDIVRRRVLRSRGQQVIGIEDDLLDGDQSDETLVVVGEGALMAALTRARGPQMRDIVATIQAEQDEAIRAPYQGVTMITGGPGTGKTVVALHRAAYLLYSNRRRFESGGVLVVGPSRVFMNYIERVLPSLGEESVTLRPIGAVADDVVRVSGERNDSAEVATIKGRLSMVGILKRLAAEPPKGAPDMLAITIKGEPLVLRADTLARIRSDVMSRYRVNQGRAAAETALINALWQRKPEEIELERDQFDDLVSEMATFRMFCNAWWPYLSAEEALARLGDPETVARVAGDLSEHDQQVLAESIRAGGEPTVADGALLDELIDRIGPLPEGEAEPNIFLDDDGTEVREVVTTADRLAVQREVDPFAEPYQTYAHILLDEAQDISPMQWRMLRRRGQHASWTIVGDLAQSSWPDPEEAQQALQQVIGNAPHREFRMSTNYRSPSEVFELAAKVALDAYPQADLPRAVRSTGVDPDLRTADGDHESSAVQAVRDLLGAVEGTVGVICPPSQVEQVTAAVEARVDDHDLQRVLVVTALQAKGLEYDGVLVVSPDDIVAESPGGSRVLYVALTRPTQRLITLDRTPGAAWRRPLG
ncbi:UvrD-helicase domain-containing protein [Microlunatus sp. Gsoil 973]|uniref:HelD family protein n=1 Tax=Microlunatus sp. Gsoil 973 TaxID=2672569 RepID=UPI0012B48670|nr:UvrD-helicase domain-containing protein [Microlunatus sp. Gsoil 973]QGN31906.1 AAA family ATPase [Microlunatus sp. Gsoil 973]